MTAPNRRITERDREVAQRLKAVWDANKKNLGLSQHQAAARLEMSQPALSQYLSGKVATNTDFIIRFANLVGVEPRELDPKILVSADPRMTLATRSVMSKGGMMGNATKGEVVDVHVDATIPAENLTVIVVDCDHYQPRYFLGERLLLQHISPEELKEGEEVLVYRDDTNELFRVGSKISYIIQLDDALKPGHVISSADTREDIDFYRVISRL
ncbi:helix-turn-helix domain-containing protein [Celeribacter sp.]|uniref:helix-turn-helix domain-containing protein n=1 Tax=Celeribacter sp. TaxID=1890673 RepID=UPI003A8FACA9